MQADLGSARVPACCARRLAEHLERSIVFTFQLSLPNVRASRRDADWPETGALPTLNCIVTA